MSDRTTTAGDLGSRPANGRDPGVRPLTLRSHVSPMSDRSDLAMLFHRRWAVPILAALDELDGAKFVTLVRRLDTSSGSVRAALDALMAQGMVERNPGYGHPLRPEYILTDRGRRIAPAAAQLLELLRRGGVEELGLRKWSMPVLWALGDGPMRFVEVRDRLGAVTDRALTRALKDLVGAGLVDRRIVDEFPPVAQYAQGTAARPLGVVLARLLAPAA